MYNHVIVHNYKRNAGRRAYIEYVYTRFNTFTLNSNEESNWTIRLLDWPDKCFSRVLHHNRRPTSVLRFLSTSKSQS